MQASAQRFIDEDTYLAMETRGETRHELVGGEVFAMAGASVRHNRIALNLASRLLAAAGQDCQVFISDIKLRADHWPTYYYPDVMLVCDPSDNDPFSKTRPCLIAEVLSPATEAIDRREKLVTYQRIPSLREYLLIRQDAPQVELYRRINLREWVLETMTPPDHIRLECLKITLPLTDLYAGLPPLDPPPA